MASTSAKVFGNYELVEQISLSLPLRQILLLRRINKACDDVYRRSVDIRLAVFLVPTSKLLVLHYGGYLDDPKAFDCETLGSWFVWKEGPLHNREGNFDRESRWPILNPFIDSRDYVNQTAMPSDKDGMILFEKGYDDRRAAFFHVRATPHLRQRGSRGAMMLTHPPTEHALFLSSDMEGRGTLVMGTYRALVEHGLRRIAAVPCRTASVTIPFPEVMSFLRFVGSVDTITGFEMLEMLQMDEDELLEQGIVVTKKESEDRES